jgi:hypothetical protein
MQSYSTRRFACSLALVAALAATLAPGSALAKPRPKSKPVVTDVAIVTPSSAPFVPTPYPT